MIKDILEIQKESGVVGFKFDERVQNIDRWMAQLQTQNSLDHSSTCIPAFSLKKYESGFSLSDA